MIADIVAQLVEFARRRPATIALIALLLSLGAGVYAAGHLGINTDIERLLPRSVPWRQHEIALDRAFPQDVDVLAIVIDGRTPDIADSAAQRLAERLRAERQLFKSVRRPDGGPFFERNGLLFLSPHELNSMSQELIRAQPLIGSLAQDPSLRGLFDALALFVRGAKQGDIDAHKLDPTLATLARTVRAVADGRPATLSWQRMLTGKPAKPRELRRFVLAQPVLDFAALEPGAKATQEIRKVAAALNLDAAHGVRVRITGDVAINDAEFGTLRSGAARSTILSIVSVCVVLFAALRSARLVGAILATLAAGLLLTAGFAALAIGSLNVISVAFAVLFIGLAVDFGIQFSVRYRDQRHRCGDFAAALRGAGRSIGGSLLLAAAATAIGFFSFVPTQFAGIRELGLIAGVGMIIAIGLNFILLPALLALLRPRGEPEPIGFRRAAPIDRFLLRRRQWVIGAAALLGVGGVALLPHLTFDFDPLHLRNRSSEAVSTVYDLMKDPTTSPYTAEVLSPSLPAAEALAERLSKLPEVDQALTAASFIPSDQKQKLAVIGDLSLLLGPTLTPISVAPPPTDAEVLKAIAKARDALQRLPEATAPQSPAAQLGEALAAAEKKGPAIVAPLRAALLGGLLHQLRLLRDMLTAKPVTLATLPASLKRDWITPDGRARVQVFPRGDASSNAVVGRFADAVQEIAPNATGPAITIQESGRTISGAFVEAGTIAVAAIVVLLAFVLRRLRDVLLVIAPLLLAGIVTLALTIVIGMPLNYANIIVLPLLLGIGVAFDIYFVMNWRAGLTFHLQSSTARAVVFSALTTLCAFGSLALSNDPGTADMGKLLSLSLACTLLSTLFVLPALLGPARSAAPEPTQSEVAERSL